MPLYNIQQVGHDGPKTLTLAKGHNSGKSMMNIFQPTNNGLGQGVMQWSFL